MINEDIIKRFLNGEADEAEIHLLRTYLDGKDLRLLKQRMARDWQQQQDSHGPLKPEMSRAMLVRIKQRMRSSKQRKKRRQRIWAAAAGFLLLISLSLWWNAPGSMVIQTTGFGEWKTIQLPDGSQIKLNANSRVSYAAHWREGDRRKVWLQGEAFFQVAEKPGTGATFEVITDDLRVEVLGTSFNVNSRDRQTDVFLEEGRIKLDLGKQEEILKPGDFLAYSAEKEAILQRENARPAELHTSWKDGVLVLRDRQVADILDKIEEIYGVQIEVLDDSILQTIKTIAVPMDKLEITIPVLEHTIGSKIIKKEHQLIIQ